MFRKRGMHNGAIWVHGIAGNSRRMEDAICRGYDVYLASFLYVDVWD